MRNATELLADYAAYHRDRRNIATHLVGVPMIVFAVCILLSRPGFELAGFALSPAWLVLAASALWYLTRGALPLGVATTAIMVAMVVAAGSIAAAGTATWLGTGIGLFVAGWVIQFVGHHYEGRKPAFVDDLTGLMIGPMFVVAEVMFALGWNRPLLAEVERRAGPTHLRDLGAART
ncbi:MAG TPA: Mpo1-like protein [Methylibium sp.]|uniref:Mpo1 family 2-hydroxy fatty acid dioxygenase n=1 Tax=Methylibium sp. TaxID=2067992 RepID=UPI002DB9F956|nr:Mpo1-like protein [Methylibium sp.]HEU4459864.1 Mpo1-like protein [Methylibium sp.]